MKKKWIAILGCTMMLGLLAGCQKNGVSTELPDCFDEETVKQDAKDAITLGESGNYEEFIKLFEDSVAKSMTEEIYEDQYLAVVKEKGAFQSFGEELVVGQTDEKTGANYAGVVVVTEYEEGKLQYTVGFDEDMKLIQFLIK